MKEKTAQCAHCVQWDSEGEFTRTLPEKKRCKMEVDACARMRFSYDNGEKFMFERNVFSLCGLL